MRDLEIRGAGNLLGDEQSGHVAALGFELYMQMLDEAVAEAEREARASHGGDPEDEPADPVRLDVNVDAYVPADYIPYEQAKIEVHRRVAAAVEVADVERLREELEDRFGPVPEPLENLLALQRARIKFGQAGARTVSFHGDRLAVVPIELDSRRAKRLREELPEALYESGRSQMSMRVPKDGKAALPLGGQGGGRAAGGDARGGLDPALRFSLSTPSGVSARVPASCPESFASPRRLAPFCLPSWGCPRAAAWPATPSSRSTATRSPKTRSTTGWAWRRRRARRPRPANRRYRFRRTTRRASRAAKAAAKPAKGQTAPTEAALKSQCEQQYKSLQQEVLGFLISSNWVLGEAKSLGVKISDKEVKKQFEKIKSQQFPKSAEFEKFLKTSGQTVSDLLLRVKLNLLSQKIQQKIVKQKSKVTQAEIAKYYKENPKRFWRAEKRNLLIILTKTEAQAKKAKQEIESGKSFESVAKRVSIDPTSKSNGGKLPGVVKGQEEKSLDAAIFSASKGTLSGPVKTPFGYYIFEVQSTTPGSQQSLKQAEASIKSQLTATRQQTALSKFVKEFKKKWMSKTDCRAGFVVTDCKQYKAPKTSSTSTPATSVPTSTAATPTTTTPATTSTK